MTEVLTQFEIDELLTAINAGCSDAEDDFCPARDARKIKIYDFKRPDKYSKEQIRTISIMHETFARLTTTSLSALLSSLVHVHVASVDQLSYEEFIRSIPTPTCLGIINLDPLKGNAIIEIDPAITFATIDLLFGGNGDGTKSQHELTDIEKSVMEGVIVRLLGNLREAWSNIVDLRPRLGQIDTNPQFAQIVHPTEMVVLVTMETKIGDVEGMINICYPYPSTAEVMDKLSAAYWYGSKDIVTKNYTLVNRDEIPVELTAEILRREFSIKEVTEWKKKTVIRSLRPINQDCCYLRLGDRRVWLCKILKDSDCFKQIKIIGMAGIPFGTEGYKMGTINVNPVVADALSMAGITISVELGTTSLPVKEILGLGEGSIVELDRIAGEPVDIKANNVLIAKGEVVVVDENFGVRITEIVGNIGSLGGPPEMPSGIITTDDVRELRMRD